VGWIRSWIGPREWGEVEDDEDRESMRSSVDDDVIRGKRTVEEGEVNFGLETKQLFSQTSKLRDQSELDVV
jgi:hypothetical protein